MKNGSMRVVRPSGAIRRNGSFTAMLATLVCGSWGAGVANAQPGEILEPVTVFLDPVVFDAGSYPYGIAAADLLGNDGLPELVVANGGRDISNLNCNNPVVGLGTVTIYQNTGNWDPDPDQGLAVVQTITLVANCVPAEVTIADIDADGDLDIIVSAAGPAEFGIYVIRNDGQGGFPQDNIDFYETALPVRGLSMADFDSDGYPDIAAGVDYCVGGPGAVENDTVFILKNRGQLDPGNFGILPQEAIHLDLDSNSGPNDIVTGEYNHDLSTFLPTRIDIISANMNDDNFSELENLGDWAFNVNTHDDPNCNESWEYTTITGDRFGADKHLDFACTKSKGNFVDVFLGDSNGNYTSVCDDLSLRYKLTDGTSHFNTWGINSGHLNGGTYIDLAATLRADNEVSVLLGRANGHFRQPNSENGYRYSIVPPAYSADKPIMVLIVDLNLDGFGDIVTTNHYTDNISVLINDLFVIPGP